MAEKARSKGIQMYETEFQACSPYRKRKGGQEASSSWEIDAEPGPPISRV